MFARRSTFAWSLVAIFTAWTFPARDALAQGPKGGEEYAKRIRERLKGAKQLHIVKDKATSRSMSMAAARGALGTADDREGPREVTVGGEKLTVVELPIERDDQTSRAIAAAEEKAELTPLLFAITPELNDPPPAPSALSRSAGTGDGPEESVKIIGAPALWRKNLRGAGVVVAVVDTGVSRHSCFENRLDIANGAVFLNGRQPGSMIMDVKGHGTHVAGTIAGSEASGFGVAPESRILPIQVLDERGNGNELDIIRGVEYAIDNGAKVINLSLALVDNQGRPARTPIPERWREVAELALAKNVALIAAAGNSNATFVSAPASFPPPNVVGVGAVFLDGRRWSDPARGQGSNFGSGQFNASKPDISAPGVSIYSAHNRASNGGWTMTGTSMATPHVAGALALLRGKHPTVKVDALVDALAKTALPPSSSELGAGILDVEKAEALLAGGSDTVIDPKPKPPANEKVLRDLEDRILFWESKGIKRID